MAICQGVCRQDSSMGGGWMELEGPFQLGNSVTLIFLVGSQTQNRARVVSSLHSRGAGKGGRE